MDGFTRYAPRIEVDTSLPGQRVVRVLEELKRRGRKPEAIVIDNGSEFTSPVMDQVCFFREPSWRDGGVARRILAIKSSPAVWHTRRCR